MKKSRVYTTKKKTEQRILQAANLAPSQDMLERLTEIHPMKQVAVMSVVQVAVFGFMLVCFWIIQLVIDSGVQL